jgi:hypothetical protein
MEENMPQNTPKQGNQTAVLWIILAAVIIIILGGLYYYMQKTEPSTNSNVVVNTNRATNTAANTNTANNTNSANTNIVANTNTSVNTNSATIDTSDWKTYTNQTYKFSFKYPPDWKVTKTDEAIDAITVYTGEVPDTGFVWFFIKGGINQVEDIINGHVGRVESVSPTTINGADAYIIKILQTEVNKYYSEIAFNLTNGYFARFTPYELEPTTGFPSNLENQKIIFGIINSFKLL